MRQFQRFGLAILIAAVVALPATAGPNAGGVLVVHDTGLLQSGTIDATPMCNQGTAPTGVAQVVARVDNASSGDPALFMVYAIFPSGSSPRLKGVTWGIQYEATAVSLTAKGPCADELNDDTWPASGTGSSITWAEPQTGLVVPVYWFVGYANSPAQLTLTAHPAQGGTFGDDTVPATLDPIVGYGRLGFNTAGVVPAEGGTPGACCNRQTGACEVIMAQACGDNIFEGTGVACDPYPCGTGPCCFPPDQCQNLTETECILTGGAFLGLDQTCTTIPPEWCQSGRYGACCSGTSCEITELAQCVQPNIWMKDYPCAPYCVENLGACCVGTQCTVQIQAECPGIWLVGIGCWQPNPAYPCDTANGACCNGSVCTLTTYSNCAAPAFWVENANCNPGPCDTYGACCRPDGSCSQTSLADCPDPYHWTASQRCTPEFCHDTPVERSSWGHIKSLYLDRSR